MAYSVAIVVERDFGDQLVELAKRLHVWVCSTPENRSHAERVRGVELAGPSIERGVTTFEFSKTDSPKTC